MKSTSVRTPRGARFVWLVLAVVCVCWAAEARFRQPNEEYAARRAKLRAVVDAPIVIFGYTGHEEASEVHVFVQEPNFYYLTGSNEPGAAVVILPGPPQPEIADAVTSSTVLYLPPRDPAQEKWEGPKLGPDDPGVSEKTGFGTVEPIGSLKGDLAKLARTYKTFYTLMPPDQEEGYPHFTNSVAQLREAVPHAKLKDITPELGAMRQVKSPGELALMRKAVDASIDAQLDAMKSMRPGLFEYQVAARMKEIHEMGGCSREAYAPIVGAGFNSTVLHYSALDDEIRDGDVVVIDVGGEYGGYAADITRTLPANAKFSPRQREIYDIVLGAQNAALAALKPGAVLFGGKDSLQQIVTDYINTRGHDKEGRTLGRYYTHGISHHIGLDVHDPGDRNRPLEPGMVVSVEPGIYIPEENLGVRIEDDVLVTKDGYELLTARLPRTADEIEKIMAAGRAQAGEHPVLVQNDW
ncbi:MAG TPA: Xaa-Pro peptidase family protein [Candidatus Acidoferrales bacterium]|nr:Xaa-Pro peptidase family protein [Candidatus Acidoferrales bacterium]